MRGGPAGTTYLKLKTGIALSSPRVSTGTEDSHPILIYYALSLSLCRNRYFNSTNYLMPGLGGLVWVVLVEIAILIRQIIFFFSVVRVKEKISLSRTFFLSSFD